jgi:hypothetical protein
MQVIGPAWGRRATFPEFSRYKYFAVFDRRAARIVGLSEPGKTATTTAVFHPTWTRFVAKDPRGGRARETRGVARDVDAGPGFDFPGGND